jgi:DNA-binding NarL/FixJ family response regulator
VIDVHPAAQRWLVALLREAFNDVSVHCEKTLEDAAKTDARLKSVDLAFIDITFPGHKLVEALAAFRQRAPGIRIVAVSRRDNAQALVGSLKAGAVGFMSPSSPDALIVAALRFMRAGGAFVPVQAIAYLDSEVAQKNGENGIVHQLTERKRDVLRLILKGRSNFRIAQELEIAEGTVKQHAHAIYKTIGVSSRAELQALANRGGIRRDGSPIT